MEKIKKIIYWAATVLLSIGMFQSGIFNLMRSEEWVALVGGLGYPEYLLIILGVWKVLGVTAILVPGFPLLKEWAYAGFFFAMSGALFSHIAVGNFEFKAIAAPLFQLLFIVLSWYFRPESRRITTGNK